VTGLCLDPLGELTVLPATSQLALSAGASRMGNEGRERNRGRQKEMAGRREGRGEKEEGWKPKFLRGVAIPSSRL